MRRYFLIAIQLVLLALLIGLFWAGWYVYHRGFTRNWRQFVNAEFEKRGLSVSISRLTLDPFHGLVARDVKVYDVKSHRREIATIGQIILDVNYSNLLHRWSKHSDERETSFLNGIDLRNTKLTLPLNPSDPMSPKVVISKLNARVLLQLNQFYLSKADADVFGIHVTATGRLNNPEAFRMAQESHPAGPQKGNSTNLAAAVIERILKLKFEAAHPELTLSFTGDAREPEKIRAELTLRGEQVRSRNYRLESFDCMLSYENGVLNLRKCLVSDDHGALDASGKWEPSTGTGDFQLRSGLNIQAVSHAFNLLPALDEFVFYGPPTIEASGEWNTHAEPAFILTGHAALKKFGYRTVIFEGFNANFSWDGTRWYVRDVLLSHRSGKLTAKAEQLPGDFRAELQSTINPNSLLPLFSPKMADALKDFDFIDSPRLQMSIRGPEFDFDKCITTGSLELGRASLRRSQMDRAECKLLIKDRAVTYQQFKIERGEGVATGSFTYDFAKHEIRLDKIKSTINPADAAPWVNPDIIKDVMPYRFKGRPNLSVNGVVQFAGGKNTNLEILVDAPNGMDYTFLKKNLSCSSISGRLLFTDGHLKLSNVNAVLFSGQLKGSAEISLERGSPENSASIQVKNMEFARLTKLYFDYDDSHGLLNGNYAFSISSNEPRTMRGSGQLIVTNGNIFAIPFLGPFTTILNTIVPGMGYDVARKATASYRVRDGQIDTPDFLVQGHGFNMMGRGKLYFLDDRMDFGIRINAQGLPGVLLFPVSELFEYASEGSLSKPVWKPKRLPSL